MDPGDSRWSRSSRHQENEGGDGQRPRAWARSRRGMRLRQKQRPRDAETNDGRNVAYGPPVAWSVAEKWWRHCQSFSARSDRNSSRQDRVQRSAIDLHYVSVGGFHRNSLQHPPCCDPNNPSQIQFTEKSDEKCNDSRGGRGVSCGFNPGSFGARSGGNEDATGNADERSNTTSRASIHSGEQSRATWQSSHHLHSSQHGWQ